MSSASDQAPAGKPQLGLWDAISIIVGIVIGTTIFKVPWLIFDQTADPMWGLLVWVLGGVIALIGAFCYAELGTTYPKAGGDYYYQTKAFGPATGFLFGWAQLTVVMPASIAAMAAVFADFAQQGFAKDQPLIFEVPFGSPPLQFDPNFAIAAYVVVILTLTNVLGVFLGKTVQNVVTFAKVVGLLGIVVAGFASPQPEAWSYSPKFDSRTHEAVPYFGALAMILVMYAYGGWNDAAFVAAEVRNPRRNIPRALFIGVGIIVFVYLLVNAAYINGLGWDNVSGFNPVSVPTRLIEGALAEVNVGLAKRGGQIMSVLVMISALGAVNGLTLTGARVYATLGAEHRLFGWMGYWRPGRGSPIMALLAQCVMTLIFLGAITTKPGHDAVIAGLESINKAIDQVNTGVESITPDRAIGKINFETQWNPESAFDILVARTAPVFWFFFLLTGLALFILREKNKHLDRPYSVPWYPVVPILFCIACGWMLYRAVIYVEWHSLFAVVLVLLGLPLYGLSRLISGPPPRDEPIPLAEPPGDYYPAEPPPTPRKHWR
jgi:amino acid transporter